MTSVVQGWLGKRCTWKMQTVLLVALRGCDGVHKNDLSKPFIRRMRATILKNADTSTTFFTNDALYILNNGIRDQLHEMLNDMDHYPIHWFMHFVHAAEIIMYKHPHRQVRRFWEYFYICALDELHVCIETEQQLDNRLQDKCSLKN